MAAPLWGGTRLLPPRGGPSGRRRPRWCRDDRHRPQQRPPRLPRPRRACSTTRSACCATRCGQFVDDRILPDVAEWFEAGHLPQGDGQGDGRARPARHAPRGLRLRRHQRRQPTAWPASSSRPATAAPAASCRCRARWPCSRSGSLRLRGAEAGVAARHGRGRGHRLLRPHRARLGQRPVVACAPGPAATATTGCSTARRCGSPTAASPTWRSSGPRPTTATTAIRGFIVPTDTPGFVGQRHPPASCRCGPRSPPSWCSTTSACPTSPRCPSVSAMRGPLSCLNEARFGILCGCGRRRPGPATRRPSTTPRNAHAVRQAHRRRSSSPSASSSR